MRVMVAGAGRHVLIITRWCRGDAVELTRFVLWRSNDNTYRRTAVDLYLAPPITTIKLRHWVHKILPRASGNGGTAQTTNHMQHEVDRHASSTWVQSTVPSPTPTPVRPSHPSIRAIQT